MQKCVTTLFLAVECITDDDCPLTKACISQECADPCRRISCGQRAECKVEQHVPYCFCPSGLQGNPLVSCVEVGCLRDEDCGQRERSEYASQACVPLCRGQVCAPGAECTAANHQEDCRCRPPLRGDGFGYCESREYSLVVAKQKTEGSFSFLSRTQPFKMHRNQNAM